MSSLLVGRQPRNRWSKPSQSSGWDPCPASLHQLQSRRPNTRQDPRRALGLVPGPRAGWAMHVERGLYTCAADVFDPHVGGGCRRNGGKACAVCGGRREGRAQPGEAVATAWVGDCMGDTASASPCLPPAHRGRAPQAGIR